MNQPYALHPGAYDDIDDLRGYIAADDPDAANRGVIEIFDAFGGLVHFPHRGHKRPDLTNQPLRFVLVRDYLVAYAPDKKPLWGDCRHARPPQPARHGGDSEGP